MSIVAVIDFTLKSSFGTEIANQIKFGSIRIINRRNPVNSKPIYSFSYARIPLFYLNIVAYFVQKV